MYKALIPFADKKDNFYVYQKGEVFPREGYEPDEEWVNTLLGSQNATGSPVIQRIRSSKKVEKVDEG